MMTALLRILVSFFSSTQILCLQDYDREPAILKLLDPFQVMALCSELQFIPNKGCTGDSFKKLIKELLEHKFPGAC